MLGLGVAGLKAHERHNIGGTHARVHALVPAQVDPLDRDRDRRHQTRHEVGGSSDTGEDRAIVVGVGV